MSETSGHEKLWDWFSLSYASFLVMPRAMMHEMPDEWQGKMADLLTEWDEMTDCPDDEITGITVSIRKNNKFASMPTELLNYRHPDTEALSHWVKINKQKSRSTNP